MRDQFSEEHKLSWRELLLDILRRGALTWVFGALLLQLAEAVGRVLGAKILGPSDQGTIELLIAWAATGIVVAGGGFATSAHIHISDTRDPHERQTILTVATAGVLVTWALLALGLVVCSFGSWIPEALSRQTALLLAIVLVGSFGEPRFGVLGLIGTGLKRYSLVGHNRLVVATVYLFGWTAGAYLFGVRGALLGWMIALLAGALYMATRLGLPWIPRISAPQRARRVVRHALQCLANQLTYQITEYLCIFILMAYHISLADIGNYGVAQALSKLLLLVPSMMCSLLLPYMVSAQNDPSQHLRLSRMLFWAILGISVVSWPCLVLIAGSLLPRFLPQFGHAESLFQVLAIAALANAISQSLGTRFLSLHLPSWNLAVTLITIVAMFVFAVVWVPRHGVWGMGYAWCGKSVLQLLMLVGLTWFQRFSARQGQEAAKSSVLVKVDEVQLGSPDDIDPL